jgi:hypothetical protein
VLNAAMPPLMLPVPNVVVPSLNVTVPVAAVGEIVAVNVIVVPSAEGLAEENSVTVELSLLTTCVSVDDVLAL